MYVQKERSVNFCGLQNKPKSVFDRGSAPDPAGVGGKGAGLTTLPQPSSLLGWDTQSLPILHSTWHRVFTDPPSVSSMLASRHANSPYVSRRSPARPTRLRLTFWQLNSIRHLSHPSLNFYSGPKSAKFGPALWEIENTVNSKNLKI